MTSITAIIPTYNARSTIGRALESALNQSHACHEILIVDDCSSDDTLAVVRAYQAEHPQIKIFEQNVNQGPAAARNRAIDAATGEWISILDSDDAWTLDRNATLIAAATQSNADIIFDNLILYDAAAQKNIRPAFANDFGIKYIDEVNFWNNCVFGTFLYSTFKLTARRKFMVYHNLYYPNMRYGEDIILYGAMMAAGATAVKIGQPCYIYTTRHGEVSGSVNTASQSLPNFMAIADGIAQLRARANSEGPPHRIAAMHKSETSFRIADKLNRLRAAVKGRHIPAALALALDYRIWRLHLTMKRRQRQVLSLRYPD